MKIAISVCILVAATVVTVTLASNGGRVLATGKSTAVPAIATEEYGKRLLGNTSEYLGPTDLMVVPNKSPSTGVESRLKPL